MLAQLLFDSPVSPHEAESCLVGFVRDFWDVCGDNPDGWVVAADVTNGVHCHVMWTGHPVETPVRQELEGRWPYGMVLWANVRRDRTSVDSDLAVWSSWGEGHS